MDLLKIREYIAEDSPVAARREMIRFISAFRSLARRPGLGHKREDLPDPDLRVWPTGAYLVVYLARRRPIEIVAVIHGSRDLESALIGRV